MLNVVTGSFRSLEDDVVARLRSRPPLESAVVVVPSGHLSRRLKRALAGAGGVAAVRICNFHELAKVILEDAGRAVRPAVEDHGEEEIFRAFLREPGAPERYRVLADRPGAAAILATVRDLRAAALSPALMREVKEELEEDGQRLAELARLTELYAAFLERIGFTTRAGVSLAAAEAAGGSARLKATPTLLIYGFYEFLGEQKDLLDALARATDLTAFVPYRKAPAYAYVERALNEDFGSARARKDGFSASPGEGPDRTALKSKPPSTQDLRTTGFTIRLFDPAASQKKNEAPVPCISAAGRADEMWYAVKEARRVHESEGVAWRDIGVLCRSLEHRLSAAARCFRDECVPWTTTASQPLCDRPLAQMAALATRLLLEDAYHMDVLEWFASPLVKGKDHKPEKWGAIARALAVVSGADWKRLEGARGADLTDGEEDVVAEAKDVDAFAAAFGALKASLPSAKGGWGALAGAWETFLQERLEAGLDEAAWDAVRSALRGLGALDRAAAPPAPEAFAVAFARALSGARIPVHPAPADGVALLDAMTARGQRFRVAILLGLNEKEWPRTPREDPYLPDASRRRIAATTGVRLLEKMEGISEERLLFALALDSADRVVLVHRRVDDEGRKEAPSSYLDEVRRIAHVEDKQPVPRLPLKKLERKKEWLTPAEHRMHALLTGSRDAQPEVVKAHALEAYGQWTPYDILSAPPQAHVTKLEQAGFSPTALQDLATCPYRYWAMKVAHLEVLDPREAEEDAAAREIGGVLHEALAAPGDPLANAKELFRQRAAKRPPLRWAVWEAARDAGVKALEELVEADKKELKDNGWSVLGAELELPFLPGPAPLPGLRGRVDRVETRERKGATEFRVTDFKYKSTKRSPFGEKKDETIEKNVLAEAETGLKLQLVAYARLVAAKIGPKAVFAGSQYFYFGPLFRPVRQGLLTQDGAKTLEGLASRIWPVAHAGQFVVVDDPPVCANCDIRAICRRGHFATRHRALDDTRFRAFRDGRLG